ncbi:MAG: indole-3-glycerol phosphate synthase TrpC [Fimbriimonadaceae bacterium]
MNILDRIFAFKREEVQAQKLRTPLAEVKARAADAPPTRGFYNALLNAKVSPALIAEVKKASPVKGVLREDFQPVEIAKTYEAAGAHALSVLTDKEFFQGSPDYLCDCRQATALPVLRKDFTVEEYHVFEARAMGADAVLLIAHGLEWPHLTDLHALAESIGLDVLLETHTREEVESAMELGAKLVGINNRDLKTFEVRLEVSEEVLPLLPPATVGVAESAIRTYEDVARLNQAGAKAVLIGSTFSMAPDIEAKVKEVMGWN